MRNFLFFFLFACACSIPNLENPACSEAREIVKEFYSYHFAEDMNFSAEKLKEKERYLTETFSESLNQIQTNGDVFTTGDTDFPKAFSIGRCEVIEENRAKVEVLLFWKDENRAEQRKINVFVLRKQNSWLIDGIER